MKSFMTYGAGIVAGVCLASTFAHAASTNYGDFNGNTVVFRDVTEESVTDGLPLFGMPAVAGNALDFNPINFVSNSSGAGGSDSTIGLLSFMMESTFGNVITDIQLNEAGDYTIFGGGGAGTSATVAAPIFINIVEIDNISVTPINLNTSMVFTPSAGDYNLADDGAGFGVIWTGVADIDIEQFLIDNNVPFNFGATKINLTMNNILATTSEAGTQANIQKKDFQGLGVTVIPEPASVMLLSAMGLGLMARRK